MKERKKSKIAGEIIAEYKREKRYREWLELKKQMEENRGRVDGKVEN